MKKETVTINRRGIEPSSFTSMGPARKLLPTVNDPALTLVEEVYSVSIRCETREEAEAVKALFPKYCRMRVCRAMYGVEPVYKWTVQGWFQVNLQNKVTGQRNEAAAKARAKALEVIAKNLE